MTHVVVTGAQGFVGAALVRRLLDTGLPGLDLNRLTLVDLHFEDAHPDSRVVHLAGNVAEAEVRDLAFSSPVDLVFHLASVPGGAAEKDYELGYRVNLEATQALLETLGRQPRTDARQSPGFVFASTIAVYGEHLPSVVDEGTLPAPALSYGAHKLASEILVADATRRGWVNGCSLRLPGVVARPGEGTGLMSAFMSQLFWQLAAGRPITLPVAAHGVAWWISVKACVDNLLHAVSVQSGDWNPQRVIQMPALRLTMAEVVDALARRYGEDRHRLVDHAPVQLIERLFASYPPLLTPFAEGLGFRHDGDADALVANALAA
jgi:D-erythronate 2-dehydrogenase